MKYILLDLDGTLTDPKEGITASARYGLNKVGHPIADDVNIDWIIGPPLKASLAKLLNVTVDHVLAEQAVLGYRERFAVKGLYENHVFADVEPTLKKLTAMGYKLYLATAKPEIYARQILEHFNLLQYFVHPYGSELNGERTNKGELIAYILEKEQLKAADCLMVGDREHDIFGARQNGIETIAVEYGYGSDQELTNAAPKARIQTFADLLQFVD